MAEGRWGMPQTEEGMQLVLERLDESRAEGDESAVGYGLLALAFQVIWVRSDNDEAPFDRCATLAQEALDIFRRLGDEKGRIAAIHRLVPRLDPERRNQLLAEADRLAIASGDEVQVARSMAAQARSLGLTDRNAAERMTRAALEIFLRHGENVSAAACYFSLSLYPEDRKAKYAAALESARLYREAGQFGSAARSASIAVMNGEEFMDYPELEPIIRQELVDAQADGSRSLEGIAYGHLAKLAVAKGEPEEAAKYLRWQSDVGESDGLTPKERHRYNIATIKEMIRMAQTSGNEEGAKMFQDELKRLKKLHVK